MKRLCACVCALICTAPAAAEDWLRIDRPTPELRAALPPRAIDYGGFVWMPASAGRGLPPGTVALTLADPHALSIDGLRIDPLAGRPASSDPWLQSPAYAGPDFRLVQLHGPPRAQDLDGLRDAGVRPVRYLAPFSYIVWASAAQLDALRARSGEVRWAGALLPAQRVPPQSRSQDPAPVRAMALVDAASADSVIAALTASGANLVKRAAFTGDLTMVELDLPGASALSAARTPGVYTLQRIPGDAGPRSEISNQSVVGNYNASQIAFPGYQNWLSQTGLTGNGVTVSIVDGGIRTTHVDLAGAMVPCTGSNGSCTAFADNHGTHVAGAVAGRGSSGVLDAGGFLRGQGVAPGASLVQQRYGPFLTGGPGGMAVDGMLDIFHDSVASGARIANNSWGPASIPQGYDIPTMQVDMIVRDADAGTAGNQPIMAVWSIMNGNGDRPGGPCAPSSLGSPDEAKNLLAVGSTRLLSGSTQLGALFDVSANSAHGPACDGRIVPHIVAPGCATDSTTSTSDTAFGTLCGTSMASPVVSGASALYWQRHRNVYGTNPSPALVKALLSATATNLTGRLDADGGVMPQRPNRYSGWGRLDLNAVLAPGVGIWVHDQETVLTSSGEEYLVRLEADNPRLPVRLMLAWTDAPGPGTGGTTPSWTNDLDLSASIDANTWRGNVIDPTSGFSATGGGADNKNNLEGIFLSPAQHAGTAIEIRVLAATIAADALNPYTPSSPRQDFALVCHNCRVLRDTLFDDGFESVADGLFADGFE